VSSIFASLLSTRIAGIAAVALLAACAAPASLVASTFDAHDCIDTSFIDSDSSMSISAARGEYDELRLPVPSGNSLLHGRRCEPLRDGEGSRRMAKLQ